MARLRVTALTVALLTAGTLAAPVGAQYRGFGKNKVQYEEFDWRIYHSPHFDVYYYESEEVLLEKVVSFAESAYDELSRYFDFQIQEPTPLIFYATHSAFEQNNIILNFIPESISAFASPARNRMVLPVDFSDVELMELIRHELTHIFQYHILFQGSLAKAATSRPPQWFMEGMASYVADDEDAHDKMVLRDAVVNDQIPSVERGNASGYFAYRYGHAVFEYIEERWGREGFLDLVYEVRNTLGGRVDRAIERTFRIEPEDFDLDFRRWLRKKYLRALVETGEPSDFGRPFRVQTEPRSQEISPVASPSGDLVAAISNQVPGELDIVLFDARRRRQLRNLTKGYTTQYRYLVSQGFQVRRTQGRDLAFSPDGNYIAAFARQDAYRNLLFFDVLNGGIARTIVMPDVDQQVAPAWSPDGRTIAYSGNRDGRFDIFLLDLETETSTRLTDDEIFDGAPVFSPDGKSLVFASEEGAYTKLFRVDLDDPGRRYRLTRGESNDKDAAFSPDGKRLYFTSDRNGYDNVYGLDLATGQLRQYTDVVTGTFMPTVLATPDENERLVYTGLWNGQFKLYETDLEEPVGEVQVVELDDEPAAESEIARFEPAIEVSVDDDNKDTYGGFKFFLENAQSAVSVDDDQTFIGQVFLTFSDYLGDRRIFAVISSFDSLSNFDITYADLTDRMQWQVNIFDTRDFFQLVRDPNSGDILARRGEVRITGAVASLRYPFSFNTRGELGLGYVFRKLSTPVAQDPLTGLIAFTGTRDDFPWAQAALVGDSTGFAPWGPISGRRWRLDANYAPDLDSSGALTSQLTADYRQYWSLTQRTNLALRAFAGYAEGTNPSFFYLGGREIRSFGLRELVGDRAAFLNLEYRFPLVDLVATPIIAFQSIRGRVFLDVGGVYFDQITLLLPDGRRQQIDNPIPFDFWDSTDNRLDDGISAYGWGFTVNFAGLDLNWDFAKRWDFKDTQSGFITTFYIGFQF